MRGLLGSLSLALLVVGGCEDTEPPRWDEGAAVTVSGERYPTLSWPDAEDDRRVAGYEVRLGPRGCPSAGTRMIAIVEGRTGYTFHPTSEPLEPGVEYRVEVAAYDAAGNRSSRIRTTLVVPDAQRGGGGEVPGTGARPSP